ncbi:MAG: STAS domain-containing protein [Candidatus Nanopelagicales bacterium]
MADAGSSLTTAGGTATLRLVGEVGRAEAEHLQPLLPSAMPAEVDSLVVDLSGCTYLDPAGVDLVGEVMGAAVDRRAAIAVRGASTNVAIILGIAGLLDLAAADGPGDNTS